MYNPQILVSSFAGVVGTRQSNRPGVPVISGTMASSSSGVFVQSKHPLVTLENIFDSAPDFNINKYPVWVSGSAYIINQVANDSGVLYKSKTNQSSSTVAPHSDATNWILSYPFSDWLQGIFNQAPVNMISEVIKQFKLQEMGKVILERQQLFMSSGNRHTQIVPSGNLVGFEMLIDSGEGLLVQIDKFGTQFTEQQTLPIYIWHTGTNNFVYNFNLILGSGSSFNWVAVTTAIMQLNTTLNSVGTFLICYFEDDLNPGNQAISKEWDSASAPCGGCTGEDLLAYNRWSQYTAFRNVKFPSSAIDYVNFTLPDMTKAVYGSKTNWGLNLSLTIRCDLTNYITYNPNLYADTLAMQLALEFLKIIAQSSRIEPSLAQIKNQARAELNLLEKSTFINSYKDSIASLRVDLSGFSKACQPCNDRVKKGKWRSV